MNGWQELASNIVTAALWPTVVLILGIMFRDTLRSILKRISKLEAFGANIEIGESVRQLDDAADKVQIEEARKARKDEPEDRSFVGQPLPLRHLVEVAAISPSAAIVDAWREVEATVLDYWAVVKSVRDIPDDKYNPSILKIIDRLNSFGMLTKQLYGLLQSLRRTRNSVAHSQSQPSEGQSLAYVDSAGLAIQTLLTDKWAIEKGENGPPIQQIG